MDTIVNWLAGRLYGLCAVLLAGALVWQTARIEGVPLLGGGFKAQVAALQGGIAARDLADAKAQGAALAARARLGAAQDRIARRAVASDRAIQGQIQTVIREVPHAVPNDRDCLLPWGAVRLLDAAASGAGLADIAARVAPGQPDGAASDVKLSEAVALLAADLGIARQNAGQLEHLEKAIQP